MFRLDLSLGFALVVCCLVSYGSSVTAESAELEEPLDIAVDFTTSRGRRVVFPFYANNVKSINPTLNQYLIEDINETLAVLQRLITNQLDKNSHPGIKGNLKFVSAGPELLSMVKRQNKRRSTLQKTITTRGTFNKYMVDVFGRMMDTGSELQKQYKTVEYQKLREDFTDFVEDLKETLAASPAAMYLRFDEAQFGEEKNAEGEVVRKISFEEATSVMIARLKNHGFGTVLNCISTMLTLIKSLSSSNPAPSS